MQFARGWESLDGPAKAVACGEPIAKLRLNAIKYWPPDASPSGNCQEICIFAAVLVVISIHKRENPLVGRVSTGGIGIDVVHPLPREVSEYPQLLQPQLMGCSAHEEALSAWRINDCLLWLLIAPLRSPGQRI